MKTIHLWLGPSGTAIVSHGVLAQLKQARLETFGLSVAESVVKPPALKLSNKGASRAEVDYENRKHTVWDWAKAKLLTGRA